MTVFYVYVWTNLTSGKCYVGKGKGNRAWHHVTRPACSLVGAAISKYGLGSFSLELVEGGLGEAEAFALESETIATKNCIAPLGYNLTAGGEGLSGPTPETRAKLSAAAKSRRASPETRAKMSEAHKSQSAETRAKISASCRGRAVSQETRELLRVLNKGRTFSPETLARMSQAHRNPSKETRARMSEAAKNRSFSAETRAKMSAAHKTRQADSLETRAKKAESSRNVSAETKAKRAATRARNALLAQEKNASVSLILQDV